MTQQTPQASNYDYDIKDPQVCPDIKPHWAWEFIIPLLSFNLIPIYSDKTFRPNDLVSRGQVSVFLDRFSKLYRNEMPQELREGESKESYLVCLNKVRASKVFSDVPTSSPISSAVDLAYRVGLFSGSTDGTFRPTENLTRLQLITAIGSLCDFQEVLSWQHPAPSRISESVATEITAYYTDIASIAATSRRHIASAGLMQAIAGFPDNRQLRPTAFVTKSEFCAMFFAVFIAFLEHRRRQESVLVCLGDNGEVKQFPSLNSNPTQFSDVIPILRGGEWYVNPSLKEDIERLSTIKTASANLIEDSVFPYSSENSQYARPLLNSAIATLGKFSSFGIKRLIVNNNVLKVLRSDRFSTASLWV